MREMKQKYRIGDGNSIERISNFYTSQFRDEASSQKYKTGSAFYKKRQDASTRNDLMSEQHAAENQSQ